MYIKERKKGIILFQAILYPQFVQNLAPAGFTALHLGHASSFGLAGFGVGLTGCCGGGVGAQNNFPSPGIAAIIRLVCSIMVSLSGLNADGFAEHERPASSRACIISPTTSPSTVRSSLIPVSYTHLTLPTN